MKPGRDQKRALQWLMCDELKCFGEGQSFQGVNGSVSNKVMGGLVDRGWARTTENLEHRLLIPYWQAEITDAGRKALEDAP